MFRAEIIGDETSLEILHKNFEDYIYLKMENIF